jgi:hypothetical protein
VLQIKESAQGTLGTDRLGKSLNDLHCVNALSFRICLLGLRGGPQSF